MSRFAPRFLLLLIVAVLGVGLLAACGDDDEEPPAADTTAQTATEPTATEPTDTAPAGPTVLDIPASEQGPAFDVTEVSAPAGEITLRMPNPSSIQHNIAVDEPTETEGDIVGQDGVSEITVNFPPGEYEYYCDVPGHRESGMVGTLTVE